MIANHTSFADHAAMTFLTGASPTGEKKYLTKMAYFKLPIFGWVQSLAGDIGVDVTDARSRLESMERCRSALDGGSSLVIYPEGGRNRDPLTLLPFKTGFARIASECGVRVLPVAMHGTWKAARGFIPDVGKMILQVGPPFAVENDDIPAALETARSWIQGAVLDLDAEREMEIRAGKDRLPTTGEHTRDGSEAPWVRYW